MDELSVSHIQNGLKLNSMRVPLVRGVRQAVRHHPVVSYGALWCRREKTLVLFSVLLLMSKCCPVLTKLLTLQHPHCGCHKIVGSFLFLSQLKSD